MTFFVHRIYCAFSELRPWVVVLMLFAYLIISWCLFWLAGETELTTDPFVFLYFSATVASTVGFGDLSPVTSAGRLIAVLWFFPASLMLYTMFLGKLIAFFSERIRRIMNGHGNYEKIDGATVIVGYHPDRTPKMVEELVAGGNGDENIILVSRKEVVDVPKGVRYVRAERLDSLDALRRAGVKAARKVILYADSDSETFNACWALRELNETVHAAAYFQDAATAKRAAKHANVETVVSNSGDMLVRAAQDPGASAILMTLGSASFESTVFSQEVINSTVAVEDQLEGVLRARDATLLAYKKPDMGCPKFRPFPACFSKGTTFYYIAKSRIPEDVWAQLRFEQPAPELERRRRAS
nr:potassium channel family protein [Roseibium sp. RKSG952]